MPSSTDEQTEQKTSATSRSFGTRSSRDLAAIEEVEQIPHQSLGVRTIVVAVAAGLIGVFSLVSAMGSTGTGPMVTPEEEQTISALHEQIRELRGERESLPTAKDADRSLVKALEAANSVARLQNNYRTLTGEVEDGELDPALTEQTRRMLTPHFDPAVSASVLAPWYLLASDATVSIGIGIPETFDSGFEWQVQAPLVVGTHDSIPVTWLAVETRAEGRKPEVLAWVQADYNMTRQVFTDVHVVRTAFGHDLGVKVKG